MRFLMFFMSHYLNEVTPSSHRATVLSFKGMTTNIAYGGVIGLSRNISAGVSLAAEVEALENDDPGAHSLDARLAGSIAWQVTPRLQVDLEADAGLAAGAPDTAILFGFADRFR